MSIILCKELCKTTRTTLQFTSQDRTENCVEGHVPKGEQCCAGSMVRDVP